MDLATRQCDLTPSSKAAHMSFCTRSSDSLPRWKQRLEGAEQSHGIEKAELEMSSCKCSVWAWSVDKLIEVFSSSSSLAFVIWLILTKQWSTVSVLARTAFERSPDRDGADDDT